MLKTIGLHIGYENKTVQNGLNLEAEKGVFICLLGTNGCGKSTLLRTLAGLQQPLGGCVLINDKDIHRLTQEQRAKLLSVVLTDRIDIDNATIEEIVSLGRYPYTSFLGTLTSADKSMDTNAIEQVFLKGREHERYNALSDGEKQRVVIAKALAQDTDVIFLDEPTAHLDVPNRIKTMLLLQRLARENNKIIICSTHDLDIALQTADTLWLMLTKQGGIIEGKPKELLQQGKIQQVFADEAYTLVGLDSGIQIKFAH